MIFLSMPHLTISIKTQSFSVLLANEFETMEKNTKNVKIDANILYDYHKIETHTQKTQELSNILTRDKTRHGVYTSSTLSCL